MNVINLKARRKKSIDVSEFENIEDNDNKQQALTSNVAILAGELGTAKEESEDEFDAAFDALAKESVPEEPDEIEELANFDDPFDTSAFDEITTGVEEELEFDSLAFRRPEVIITPSELTVLPQKSRKKETTIGLHSKNLLSVHLLLTDLLSLFPHLFLKTIQLDPSQRPSVVVKAPSNDSIKSWNCAVADSLIHKSQLEAQEAALQEESEESDEDDPFDTTEYDHKVPDIPEEESEDPFDTSNIGELVPGEAEIKALGAEGKIDLLGDNENTLETKTLEPQLEEPDPFDTDFASKVLPNKGDPFDTSFVESGEPGKAEIRALEEEFIDKEEEFEVRNKRELQSLNKVIAKGSAGRARPYGNLEAKLQIKVPDIADKHQEEEEVQEETEDEIDPFDTSIVDKVIPAAKQKIEEELDPFDTSIAGEVIPELKSPEPPPSPPKQAIETQISTDTEANPFLADVAPPSNQPQQPPNPFLAETLQQVPPSSTHSQQAYYNGGSSNMAANPFATDAYSAQPQQQYYGHYGQFPQMHSYGVAQHPPPPDSNLVGAAAFGVVSHEPVHELPQKSPHELMTEIPSEPPQEYIKEIPQKPPQEFVKEIPKELPQQVIKEIAKEPPQEILGEPSQKKFNECPSRN
ncbi:unnamed protein product [Lepeophtheirus salmonis]|uniref:(salmon louse) hypothetical protein n=1 Tax=Lepeophtheirus salmonis TaxID=72036 RepID=A0A7R8CXV0_LEPSM|nr:unnamed protein product [Lepeophtheirus salmonis]CAF2935504.1 unnamed protein product [Lepeophtheirus salmonis]